MFVSYIAKSLEPSKYSDCTILVEQVNECPICKKAISPVHLNTTYIKNDQTAFFESHLLCSSCVHTFIGSYTAPLNSPYQVAGNLTLVSVQPQLYKKYIFDEKIALLSPQFVKIYNQALAAESMELDEIAGLGYRKSLEFLVKDFAIHQYPDCEEDIKKLMLSPCIKKYIDNEQIKTLVERSAWIGNDEAHYIRKQEGRDVNDMKNFIKATVYFIGMVLITEDAATIEPAK